MVAPACNPITLETEACEPLWAPGYSLGYRELGKGYTVWVQEKEKLTKKLRKF